MSIIKSRILLVVAVILAIMCGFIFYFNYGTPWGLISYENQFEKYLDDKYDKDFVIEKISFDLIHGGTYHADAHAENETDVTFYVGQNTATKAIEDSYHFETWQKQASLELGPIVKKYYPDNYNYAIMVIPVNNPSINEKSQIPNYKNYTTVEIGVSIDNFEVTNVNRDSEIERSYLLLNALKEHGIKFNHFSISYRNKTMQLKPVDIHSINGTNDLEKWLINYR